MKSRTQTIAAWKSQSVPLVIAILCALGLLSYAALESNQTASAKAFATPNEAAQSFIQAANTGDVASLREILGPDAQDLISSADHVGDNSRIAEFAALAREKESVTVDPEDPNTATLSVGNDDWPLPIPIVKRDSKWYYDAKAGGQEILFRRVGENELDAMKICQGFVEAQKEYALDKHDGAEVNQYAQRIISTPGKQDGLAWQNKDGSWGGPVGETVANALAQGYSAQAQPFHGYFFKVLKG